MYGSGPLLPRKGLLEKLTVNLITHINVFFLFIYFFFFMVIFLFYFKRKTVLNFLIKFI